MKYINIKDSDGIETVDEFPTMKEAMEMLKEYRLGDSYNNYYISSRSTREWREKLWFYIIQKLKIWITVGITAI